MSIITSNKTQFEYDVIVVGSRATPEQLSPRGLK